MIATELHIENFRGIREGKLTDLADVNVLIGRNGSGKSTVGEAVLRVAMGQLNVTDVAGRNLANLFAEQRHESKEHPEARWFRSKLGPAIRLAVVMPDAQSQIVMCSLPGMPFRIVDKEIDEHALWALGLFRPIEGSDREIEKHLWTRALLTRNDKLLIAVLNDVFGIGCEQIHKDGETILLLFDSYGVPLDAQGEGVRTALRSLLYVLSFTRGLLVLEEPECHQHPASLQKYARAVVTLAKERGVQLFVTTQSKTALMAFVDGAEAAKSSAMVHHLALQDGVLDVRAIAPDTLRGLEASGLDVQLLDQYA